MTNTKHESAKSEVQALLGNLSSAEDVMPAMGIFFGGDGTESVEELASRIATDIVSGGDKAKGKLNQLRKMTDVAMGLNSRTPLDEISNDTGFVEATKERGLMVPAMAAMDMLSDIMKDIHVIGKQDATRFAIIIAFLQQLRYEDVRRPDPVQISRFMQQVGEAMDATEDGINTLTVTAAGMTIGDITIASAAAVDEDKLSEQVKN